MLRIKMFGVALVLGLAGAVYAAGRAQDAAHQNHAAHGADKAAACCQAKHRKEGEQAAASCDKDVADCCKGHSDAATKGGESCCKEGAECCAGGGAACCKGHKEGGAVSVVKTGAGEPAASCCKDGAACCKDGADCCKAHPEAGAQTASADKKDAACECCGDSCPMHAGR